MTEFSAVWAYIPEKGHIRESMKVHILQEKIDTTPEVGDLLYANT